MAGFIQRVASAPISWGICEVPGWGRMLPTERVLGEMSGLGIRATELGAPGFLPDDAAGIREALDPFGMEMIGGFTPLVLHRASERESALAEARRVAALFAATGARNFVTAVITDADWSDPEPLSAAEFAHLKQMLSIIDDICEEHGLQQVLHPHVQTVVETRDDINRVLDNTSVRWCFDTGHVALSGFDPLDFARQAAGRIGHVHLKDVDLGMTDRVLSRELSLMEATQAGLFTNLGDGDVPIAEIVLELERSGYDGWYVIEQDTAITGEMPPEGGGPVTDVANSLEYLRAIDTTVLTER
jgi:inosose dehydratase